MEKLRAEVEDYIETLEVGMKSISKKLTTDRRDKP